MNICKSGWSALALCLALGDLAILGVQGQTSVESLKALIKNPEDAVRIEQAAPRKASVPPRQPRKLLIFDLNVNYGGHGSIPHANFAFALMGEQTGAFKTTVSRDPAVFERASLSQFDAVFFNNNVGNLFTNAELRQNLVEFVCGGGGLLGVHGTSVAFTRWPGALEDWPEFGLMIGARGANHREATEQVFLRLDDPGHPLNQVFGGQGFFFRDEFFRVSDPYSRQRVRVLLSLDLERTEANQGRSYGNLERADKDFALAWIRNYGRGRTFYCTIAHNPYVFWDPKMLEFYLGAIQFALGDLAAPTLPSGKLTPPLRAQEKLGWRLGLAAETFPQLTFFEAIDQTAKLGVPYIGGGSSQKLSREIPKNFGPDLTDEELRQARFKLDAAGVRLLTYSIPTMPSDEANCRKVFEFGRKMGVEAFISEPAPEALNTVAKFCDEYRINVALRGQDRTAASRYANPEAVLRACEGRTARIGACADLGPWLRAGIDPVQAARKLKQRVMAVIPGEVNEPGAAGKTGEFLKELRALGIQPAMIGLEQALPDASSTAGIARSIECFNVLSQDLTK